MIFNLFKLDQDCDDLPVGFQIEAVPYRYRFCMCSAAEIEASIKPLFNRAIW